MTKRIMAFFTLVVVCCTLLVPSIVEAAQLQTTEVNEEYVDNKDEIQKKNDEVIAKWNTLTSKQKSEIYKSVKGTLDAQAKFLDKLVKYELMSKEDAQAIKDDMYAKFDEMKSNDSLFSNGKPQPKEEQKKESGRKEATPTTPPDSKGGTTPTQPAN